MSYLEAIKKHGKVAESHAIGYNQQRLVNEMKMRDGAILYYIGRLRDNPDVTVKPPPIDRPLL